MARTRDAMNLWRQKGDAPRFWPHMVPLPLSGVLGRRWRARQDSNLRPSA